MTKIKAVISDADGTLVNTLYLIRHGQYEAAAEYLNGRGISRSHLPPYEVYEDYINKSVGGPTRQTLQRTLQLLFSDHQHLSEQVDFDELDRSLQPVQDRLAPLYVHPFYGLTQLFDWLGRSDLCLGIFTSGSPHHIVRNFGVSIPALGHTELYRDQVAGDHEKLHAFKQRVAAVFGISKLAVVTCEDVSAFKPDPEGILKLLDELGLQKNEVIVIGDHAVDMQAAKAAGIQSVGVSHGFGTPAELHAAGAKKVVHTLHEVMEYIEELNMDS
jgi:phosphoglycolate phosphatase-like HAD superfamily hydrolase